MSQMDELLEAAASVAVDLIGDGFEYQTNTESGPEVWRSMRGVVYETALEDLETMPGFNAQRSRLPITVQFMSEVIPRVNEKRDRVRWNGEEYTVTRKKRDGGMWTLLCL